jgi:hypothetical protein
VTGDLTLQRGRNKNIHLQAPEGLAGDGFSARETGNLFVLNCQADNAVMSIPVGLNSVAV